MNVCNFIVKGAPRYCALKPRAGDDKALVRELLDCADGEPKALQNARKIRDEGACFELQRKFQRGAVDDLAALTARDWWLWALCGSEFS